MPWIMTLARRPTGLLQGCVQLPPSRSSLGCWCPLKSQVAYVPRPSALAAPSLQALAPAPTLVPHPVERDSGQEHAGLQGSAPHLPGQSDLLGVGLGEREEGTETESGGKRGGKVREGERRERRKGLWSRREEGEKDTDRAEKGEWGGKRRLWLMGPAWEASLLWVPQGL